MFRWVLILIAMFGLTACDTQPAVVNVPQTTVILTYDDSSLVIENAGPNRMENLAGLQFVREEPNEGSDDYTASNIPNNALLAGSCYRLSKQNNNAPVEPVGCTQGYVGNERMTNVTGLFWRTEPVYAATFRVFWEGSAIQTCLSYGIDTEGELSCTFEFPSLPEDAN